MTSIAELLDRVRAATGPDNALDIAIEIALFKPDDRHVSVRPNAAGTKLVYTTHEGRTETFWAADHTLTAASRAAAAALLSALSNEVNQDAR